MTGVMDFVLVNVFTDRLWGGNQLAVFPFAHGLTDHAMEVIACELKVNETVFVTGETPDGFVARIFSPHGELPFAGHPVIGTAFVLADRVKSGGKDGAFVLHVPAGPVPINLTARGRALHAMLRAPTLPKPLDMAVAPGTLATMLGLEMHELESGGWRAAAFSAGVPFLCIPLSSRAAVAKARLRKSEWSRSIKNSVAPHVYIFSLEDRETIFARMFAPGVGIDEDPATGAAAVALGGYLASYELSGGGHRKYTIHQGAEIGRPSMIDLEVDAVDGALVAVGVGGYGVFLGRGTLASEFAALCSTHFPGRREAATNDD